MSSKVKTTPKERLVIIKKAKDEPLKRYLACFNKLVIEMEKISDEAMLMAVISSR